MQASAVLSVAGAAVGSVVAKAKKQIACRSSHNRDGDTLVEQSRWAFRGHEIIFQSRFTLFDDEEPVQITERPIAVPVG